MAYGDLGFMAPREAYYTGPSRGVDAVKVEATKRASYLSSMDQFYAQLEEMERQFDIGTRLAEERQEWTEEYGTRELDIREAVTAWEQEFREKEFEWQEEYGEATLEQQMALGKMQSEAQVTTARLGAGTQRYVGRLGLKATEMEYDWKEEEAQMTKRFLEDYFERQETGTEAFGTPTMAGLKDLEFMRFD